jgi:hypothetical protein
MLEPAHLVFRPEVRTAKLDHLGDTVLALEHIQKVVRARGSPVLELHVTTAGLPPVVLFYFVKPPDIYSSGMANPRFAGVSFLLRSNALLLDAVVEWEHAIQSAVQAGGS